MFPSFSELAAVGAPAAAVRLPRPAASTQGRNLLGTLPKVPRPVPAPSATPRERHRADQARYQARCRVAMSF